MVVHWDEIEREQRAFGHIRALRQPLGAAAGAQEAGLSRWRIEDGDVCAPAHVHADEEEIFYVLEGAGHVLYGSRAFPIGTGDAVVFRAGDRPHTVFGGPIDLLAFSSGSSTNLTWLPRSDTMWAATRWLPLGSQHPFEAEQALGPLALPEPVDPADGRPPWIVGVTDVEGMVHTQDNTDFTETDLGTAGGSQRSGLVHQVIAPGRYGRPHHCHASEEELFVVLDGTGVLELDEPGGTIELPVRRGSIVARPRSTGVAHAFRAGPDAPLTVLAYGQRDPCDISFSPRSGIVRMWGLGGLAFRVTPIDEGGVEG